MLKIAFTTVLLLWASQAAAISNIESERPGLPREGWSGHVEVGLDGKTGNQREKTYTGAAKVTHRQGQDIQLAIAERAYGSTRGVKDTDSSFVHGRWIHLLTERWAVEGFVQWEQDEFDNLESRSLVGGGGRYQVAEIEDVFSVAVGLGAFREREVQDLQTYTDETYTTRVNSFVVYQHRLNPQIIVSSTLYYQPNIDRVSDYRALLDAALSVELTDTLSLKVHYKVTQDSDPAQNLEADPPINNRDTNTEYHTSLVYNF